MRSYDERALFLSDIHVPFHDEVALDVAIQFSRFFKPNYLFLMGDIVDCYSVSRFDKDPKRRLTLQGEVDATQDTLAVIRKAVGAACKVYYVEGNHEYRLERYLWSKAPELGTLRELSVEALLGLSELGITYVSKGKMEYHGFIVKHGHVIRKWAGYSAHAELEKNGKSGASGHTHRLAQIFRTDLTGVHTWIETGCLCDLEPEYMEGQQADWQHGLAYGMFRKQDKRFAIHAVPIVDGSLIFGSKEIVSKLPTRPSRPAGAIVI